jgi:amino acid permease
MSKKTFAIAAIVAAATVGDGVFALPYIFYSAGWLLSLFYVAALAAIIIMAHSLYLATLEKVGEKQRLLGLAKRYFGSGGFWLAFCAIVIGLLLTLVAYLILGAQFIHLAIPTLRERYEFIVFLALMAIPLFLDDAYVMELELAGIICTTAAILLVFLTAIPHVTFAGVPAVDWHNFFLPFGTVLFALAGWTSIEPAYEAHKRSKGKGGPWTALAMGTGFAAVLYIMFSAGIIGSTGTVSADTLSGLAQWPFWKKEMIAILGLIAVATVYMPISREIKNALEKDLGWGKIAPRLTILLFPPLLVFLGLNNFLFVVGVVGGVFLSTQYLLIISVGRKALELSPAKKALLNAATALFLAAAVYSVYTFIVR